MALLSNFRYAPEGSGSDIGYVTVDGREYPVVGSTGRWAVQLPGAQFGWNNNASVPLNIGADGSMTLDTASAAENGTDLGYRDWLPAAIAAAAMGGAVASGAGAGEAGAAQYASGYGGAPDVPVQDIPGQWEMTPSNSADPFEYGTPSDYTGPASQPTPGGDVLQDQLNRINPESYNTPGSGPGQVPGTSDMWNDFNKFLSTPTGRAAASLGTGAALAAFTRSQRTVNTTSSQQTQLSPPQQAAADDQLARTRDLTQQPYQPYSGPRVAPFNSDQQSAFEMTRRQAGQPNPLLDASNAQTQKTINGDYLNPQSNPYLQQTYDAAASRMADAYGAGTSAQTLAGFANNGAFGGSAMQEQQQRNNRAFGDSLANLGNQIYGGNYQAERDRQAQASLLAPKYAQDAQAYQYRNATALNDIGSQQQAHTQRAYDTGYNDYLDRRNWPYYQLDQYRRAINPAYGSNTTSQQQAPGVSGTNAFVGGVTAAASLFGSPTTGSRRGLLDSYSNY